MYMMTLTTRAALCLIPVREALDSRTPHLGGIRGLARRLRRRLTAMLMATAAGEPRTRELFATVMREYDDMVSRICFGYALTEAEFGDLRQDALINIWQGLPKYRGDSSLRTWVYRVTLNTCVTTLRKRYSEPDREDLERLYSVIDESEERRHMIAEMHECISQLSAIDKAIMLMWLDEFSYDEIAATMGMPRNTVATRLRRARARLASEDI